MRRIRNTGVLCRGVTLVEVVVVIGVGSVVFGLILACLVETSRASGDVTSSQQMRQEALLVGQSVEKVLRYRVDADEILLAQAAPETTGQAGAAAATTTTGTAAQAAHSTVPKSLEGTLPTSPTMASTPEVKAARTPTAAELTSVPATLKPLLSGTTESAALRPPPGAGERYSANELAVYSLADGINEEQPLAVIRNSHGLENEPRHAFVERSAPQGNQEATVIALGSNSDSLQSSVSFRYASEFNGPDAQWTKEAAQVPRLVEYTVRVWAKNAGSKFVPRDASGRSTGFEYTSAVEVR